MNTSDVYAQANAEFQCDHPHVALRRRTVHVAGKPVAHIWRQCMACGHGLGAVARQSLAPSAVAQLEDYDEQAPAQWRERWAARLAELRRQKQARESDDWWVQYEAYLATPQWAQLRAAVLARDKGICQGCLGRSGLPATQAHHLSYEHLGAEFAWELVALCSACHERVHGRRLGVSSDVAVASLQAEPAEDLDEVPF